MKGHQEYLEAPYVDADKRQADFEEWCEANGIDPGTDVAWEKFDIFLASQEDDIPDEAWEEGDES